MAVTLKEVLEHLVRHGEGYHTPAIRQEHLDAIAGAVRAADPEDMPDGHVHAGSEQTEES